jgi:phenylacetate-CoA ligase
MATIGDRRILPIHVQLELEAFGAPEFTLRAGASDQLCIKVESPDAEAIRRQVSEALDVPVAVESLPTGSLPRSTYKPRRLSAD